VRDLARPGTRILETGLGKEEERAHSAVREAEQGHAVALIGSGDAGVYAMASPALEVAGDDIDVVGVPGVTAALAASNLLGAPMGHDHASISLSDLHTPWPAIESRIRAVAEADLVVTFYNPRSRGRDWQLPKAVSMLLEHRPRAPVGVVTDASRPRETVHSRHARRARRRAGADARVRGGGLVADPAGRRAHGHAAGVPVDG
jgi:cobalt-precorrin 5A hydrolase/precorrin-3B C17-methyltransferase